MLSLGVSGVRTLGSVMLAPDCWPVPAGKGLLVDGERDSDVSLTVDSGELGAWTVS